MRIDKFLALATMPFGDGGFGHHGTGALQGGSDGGMSGAMSGLGEGGGTGGFAAFLRRLEAMEAREEGLPDFSKQSQDGFLNMAQQALGDGSDDGPSGLSGTGGDYLSAAVDSPVADDLPTDSSVSQDGPQQAIKAEVASQSTQAQANPAAGDKSPTVVDTGTGTGQSYNVHNGTNRDQYFLYSDSSGHKAIMHLAAGQVGTFTGGNNQPGIRIQTCGPNGETRSPANQALFEAGTESTANGAVNNPDVSDVDGNLSYDGRGTDIEITNNLGQKVGNATGDAYRNWNDDTKTDASNPMTMAQTKATQFDITFTDSAQIMADPGIR